MTMEATKLHFGDRVQITTEATFWGIMTYGGRVMVLMDNGVEATVSRSEVKKVSEWGFLNDADPLDDGADGELEGTDYPSTDEGGID